NVTKDTKLKDIMQEYPWLLDELIKVEPKFKLAKTPVGKMLLKSATITDLSKRAGMPEDELIENLEKFVKEHEQQ
ncbi:MAG: DUF1858 domain-containing protein, partial [Ruminococcus sp.]|nr:DUF1858 domain-containing protein [Ruminococcus sp.]